MKRDKIVVIEDEASILEVIDYNLTREGFEVIPCKDGRGGLRTVQTQKPSLVLLDLTLPDLDGVEVCRIVRSDPAVRHIPIITVTAKGEESDAVLRPGVGARSSSKCLPKRILFRAEPHGNYIVKVSLDRMCGSL